jgi:hypothetical protein
MSFAFSVQEFLLRFAASGLIPATWFIKNRPKPSELAVKTGQLHLEIVSHCWNYANMLTYQLASLAKYPPQKLNVTMTVFYSAEDSATVALLNQFKKLRVENVNWNFQCLTTPELLRRAIGRNKAAKASQADWVWFTDCDVLFYENALDTLSDRLQAKQSLLVYPHTLLATPLLESADPMLQVEAEKITKLDIDREKFSPRKFDRATGPIQIMHGDAARLCGYCADLKVYQTPRNHWAKTYEDRAFRWLLGTQGEPLQIPNIYWIRHQEKGRYRKDSGFTGLRKLNRKLKSTLLNR